MLTGVRYVYNIALCENSPNDQLWVSSALERIFQELDRPYLLTEYSSGEEFLYNMKPHLYDLVIFDVEMKRINGIEAARRLREVDRGVIIIFSTVHSENCFSCFAAEPLQYFLKPLKFGPFREFMFTVVERIDHARRDQFSLTFNNVAYCVPISDIMYFQSHGRQVEIQTAKTRHYFYSKLGEVEQNPLLQHFIRCCQSFLINPDYVKRLKGENIYMANDEILPISRGKSKQIRDQYLQYIAQLRP